MGRLLDTNGCIRILRQQPSLFLTRYDAVQDRSTLFICTIVKFELYYGAYKGKNTERALEALKNLFKTYRGFPYDDAAAQICGRIRADLAKTGKPIGPYDLQIASIALANNLTLITHNTSEFSRVPGLLIEDWEV